MDILKIAALGERLGYTGDGLKSFIKEEEKKFEQREAANRERDERRRQREEAAKEREREEKEKERIREQEEREAEHRRQLEVKEKERLRVQEEKEAEHRRQLELKQKEFDILALKKKLAEENDEKKDAQSSTPRPKLPKFDEVQDDMDAYLERFERYATSQHWTRDSWAVSLSPLLTGKGLQVYTSMPAADSNNYDKLKVALLKRYQLTADGFQRKFREGTPETGESVLQYVARLSRYLQRWIELSGIEKTFEALCDLIIREQFLNTCYAELAIFIKERVPRDIESMTELAEQYLEAHDNEGQANRKSQRPITRAAAVQVVQQTGNLHKSSYGGRSPNSTRQRMYGDRRCFICHRSNHIARDCFYYDSHKKPAEGDEVQGRHGKSPGTYGSVQRISNLPENRMIGMVAKQQTSNGMSVYEGVLNGRRVKMLRDTGCNSAAVKKTLVAEGQITDKVRPCILIDGTERQFRVAKVHIDTPFYKGEVEAMVMDNPLYDLILGNIPGVRDHPDPD